MKERDCANCKHHTEDGCSSWDCEYEPKDLISRTDAIEAVIAQRHKVELSEYNFALGLAADAIRNLQSADAVSREECDECKTDKEGVLLQQLAELQSDYETMKNAYEDALAHAVPTVIRAKALMRKKDFDKWAEDIKKQNQNIICIPCDAEVVSADSVEVVRCGECKYLSPKMADRVAEALTNEWTPITVSEPNTSNHVLVTYKWDEDDYETSELDYWVTKHEAENGNEKCKRLIDHVIAWQSLPTPYKGGDDE